MKRILQHAMVPLVFAVLAGGCASTGTGKVTPAHDCSDRGVFWDMERGCKD